VLSEGLAVLPYSVAEIQKEAEVLKGAGTGPKKKTSRVSVVGRVGVAVGVGAVILAAGVDFHIDNARHKLGAATRIQAVIKAKDDRLIEP